MTCFTPGTPIATPRGPVMAEDLRPGDTVITRDNGLRRIIWTDRRTVDYAALQAAPHLRPVLLRRGSLGDGLPATDMMVAPNQRILVESDRTALFRRPPRAGRGEASGQQSHRSERSDAGRDPVSMRCAPSMKWC
ncbi:MAG: Hint domain-containing protein [Defluviimonas denitrificans]